MLLAVFFRFYLIKEMPGGLFPDEAANGLDINLMSQGHLQPFYERGNGREALFFYMLWASVTAFGRGAWQHHIVSALVGTLAVLGCFLVTKELFSSTYRKNDSFEEENEEEADKAKHLSALLQPQAPTGVIEKSKAQLSLLATQILASKSVVMALLASFLMATSSWHTVLSRTAFRANTIPLIATFTMYFGLKIFSERDSWRRVWWSIFFGVCFALGFYTYIAFRIMVPIIAMLVVWPILADIIEKPRFQSVKKYFSNAIIAGLFFIITIAPIGYYFYSHPGSFIGRSGQVSVFNPELNGGHLVATIAEVTKQSFLGYITYGDLNWRHNISGYPFLSPFVSPFFVLGLLLVTFLAIRYFLRPVHYAPDFKHFLLAGWFYGMLLPVITTAEGIPHGLRSIGTIPSVFIISAYGMYMVYTWVSKFAENWTQTSVSKKRVWTVASSVVCAVYLAVLPIQTYNLYFVKAYNNPENFYAFRSDLTVVSDYLKQHGNRATTYLVVDTFSVQTVDYFTSVKPESSCDRDPAYLPKDCVDNPINKPYIQIDPEDSWRAVDYIKDGKLMWQNGFLPGDQIVFTQSSIFDIAKFKQYHPNTQLVTEARNKFGQAVLAVYQVE